MKTLSLEKIRLNTTVKLSVFILIYSAALILLLIVITELKIDNTTNKGEIKPNIEQPLKEMSPQ